MAKIPTYNNMSAPTGRFVKPRVGTAQLQNISKVINFGNEILDDQAAEQGYNQGIEAQKETLKQGGMELVKQFSPFSIRGKAFKEGAKKAYVSAVKTKTDEKALELYNKHVEGPESYTLEKFNADYEQFKTESLASMPTELQVDLGDYINSQGSRYAQNIFTNQLQIKKQNDVVQIQKRVNSEVADLSELLRTNGIGLPGEKELAPNILEEQNKLIASITSLIDSEILSPSGQYALELELQDSILKSLLAFEYDNATDKKAFVNKINSGDGSAINEILTETNDLLSGSGSNIKLQSKLSVDDVIKYGSLVTKIHNNKLAIFASDRSKFSDQFTTEIAILESGNETPYVFDKQRAIELGFDQDTITKYENTYNNAKIISSRVDVAKTMTTTDLSTTIQTEQKKLEEAYALPYSEDKINQITILEKTIAAYNKEQKLKLSEIQSGDFNDGLVRAGYEVDLTTKEGVETYYTQAAELYGIASNRITLPSDVIETYKTNFNNIQTYEQFIGTINTMNSVLGDDRTKQFLADSGIDEEPYGIVFELYKQNPSVAYQTYESIKNSKVLEDSLKQRFVTFDDDVDAWQTVWQEQFDTELPFDANINSGIYEGMKAYWLGQYQASGGNQEKATNSTINFFKNKLFDEVEIMGSNYLLPKDIDANVVKATYEDIFENPQRYGIFTDSTFTLKEFQDNPENYRPVVKGNTVYIQQTEGGQTSARIYQKLPSGQNDFVLSTVGFTSMSKGAETYNKDVEATWQYDKSSNFDKDLETILAPRFKKTSNKNRKIKYDPTSDPDEAAEELRKLFYTQEVKADGKIEYADVFAGELTTNPAEQQTLNAISYYIKDGTMSPWVLDYLADNFDFLSDLENDSVKQQVINEWNSANIEKHIKTTSGDTPITMTPLASLSDLVKSIARDDVRIDQIVTDITTNNNSGNILVP
tara:strand:+ start:1409 stop:4207 length:2799 start_codon:yes stop_codon:yes gene_type:complete